MIGRFFGIASDMLAAVGRALDQRGHGFDDYEAGDWLAHGGRMECDGPDAADTLAAAEATAEDTPIGRITVPVYAHRAPGMFSAAGVAAEPPSAPGSHLPVAADTPRADQPRAEACGAGHPNLVSAAATDTPNHTRGPGASGADQPNCGELQPRQNGLRCTMPTGHAGRHVGGGPNGAVYETWPQTDELTPGPDRPLCEVVTDLVEALDNLVDPTITACGRSALIDYARDCLIPEGRDLAAQLEALEDEDEPEK